MKKQIKILSISLSPWIGRTASVWSILYLIPLIYHIYTPFHTIQFESDISEFHDLLIIHSYHFPFDENVKTEPQTNITHRVLK